MMQNEIILPEAHRWLYFFLRQGIHLSMLMLIAVISYAFASLELGDGSWMGMSDRFLFWKGLVLAVIHQVVVWIIFRTQLRWAYLSKLFGRYDLLMWWTIFIPLLVLRPVVVFGLGMADQGTIGLPPVSGGIIGVILLVPAMHTFYSVTRYFGLVRALSGDHFRVRYRKMSLVQQGALR